MVHSVKSQEEPMIESTSLDARKSTPCGSGLESHIFETKLMTKNNSSVAICLHVFGLPIDESG